MIITLLINVILSIVGIIFMWLPVIHTLPTINGFDIDGAFVTGMGQLNTVMSQAWALQDFFIGFLFIMGYYILKMVLKTILGSRAPHN
jgi:hypothetical protein